jgi:hypothetical protein
MNDAKKHLYVFQDSTGRIKVGRSIDPEKRRKTLQRAGGRRINIVLVLKGRGDEELRIHDALAANRGYGEWFANSDACRRDLCAALGVEIKWTMPTQQYVAEWRRKKEEEESRAAINASIEAYFSRPVSPAAQRRMDRIARGEDLVSMRRRDAGLPVRIGPPERG